MAGLADFLNSEVFASPIEAIVADGQRIVGQPVEFKTDALHEVLLRPGREFTVTFEAGVDMVVRVDGPGAGTVIAVRQTPRPVDWDEDGNAIRWEP